MRDKSPTALRRTPDVPAIPPSAALRPVALIVIAFGALRTIADPDIWGHVRFGLDILSAGHLSAGADPYSFTADRVFLYHEWLGGVIMAAAYQLAGPPGLMVLKAVLVAAPCLMTMYALRTTRFDWRWLGVLFVASGTLALAATVRPQLWTTIALVIALRILTGRSRKRLWLLPPLFTLWANLHGGWIVGGGVVAVWTVVAWFERNDPRWTLLAVGAASLACTLLTPNGLALWSFLLETVRLGREDISEWSPIWRAGPGFAVMWALTVALFLVSWRRIGRPSAATLVILVGFAVAAARVNRLVPLFAVAAVMLLSRQWPPERATPSNRTVTHRVVDGVFVAAFMLLTVVLGAVPRCITLEHSNAPDTIAAEALRGTRGRLVTYFDWGEYALWHFGPALQVSIDGRRETLYSMNVLHEQLGIARGSAEGLQALQRIRPEYVWLPADATAAASWLREHDYREDVRTPQSFVAVRNDLPRLSPFTGESSGCFPGP